MLLVLSADVSHQLTIKPTATTTNINTNHHIFQLFHILHLQNSNSKTNQSEMEGEKAL